MIDSELLAMLCCPENHADLILATAEQTAALNEAIAEGKATNRKGENVQEPLDEALIRADFLYAYPVRKDIPVMLIEEAILLEGLLLPEAKGVHRDADLSVTR